MTGGAMPAVDAAEALGDRAWFGSNPHRRYRRRAGSGGCWIVRRRLGDVLLRTFMRTLPHGADSDDALRRAWFETAWAELEPAIRDKLIKAARQAERSKKATRRAKEAPAGQGRTGTDGGKS